MQGLVDGLTLYHGSYCEVQNPDLMQCAKYKDFGQGFYLTSSKEQAMNFLKTSVKKAALSGNIEKEQKYGVVSGFRYEQREVLKILTYPEANVDWLHCVVGHRRKNTFSTLVKELETYDVIAGKIANDNTNATIAAYMAQAYGKLGSASADEMCIRLLLPEKLEDQFCFRTKEALESISFIGSEQIWL